MQALLHTAEYILSFVFVFTLIVFVHEMGHFLAARVLGARVEVFSIGFGKTLFQRTDRHGTVWRVSLFPVGGFVKFAGDANAASAPDREAIHAEAGKSGAASGMFHLLPVWRRSIIVAAGPLMNFLYAMVVFAALLMAVGSTSIPARVQSVEAGSPAAHAGFQPGDVLIAADGRKINTFSDVAEIVAIAANTPITFLVRRDGSEVKLRVTPKLIEKQDMLGKTMRIGYLGISADARVVEHHRYGPLAALAAGARRTWNSISDQLKFLGRLVRGRGSVDMLGGPLRIFAYTGAVGTAASVDTHSLPVSFAMRIAGLMTLSAMLSVAIGLVNLLPVPVLDGGHLLYYAFEAVAGRPLSERVQLVGFRIGLALILGLMVFATFNDLRYFGLFERIGRLFS